MISLFFANVIGWLTAHWRWFVLGLGAFLLLILVVMAFRGCGGQKAVKIDEEAIQKVNSQNEAERKKQLQKIIDENSEIIKTVDERSNIAETNRIERERLTDEKIAEVDKKIVEAKSQGKDVSQEELVCLLQPTECK